MPALNCVGCSAQSPKNNYNMKWDGRKCRGEAAWEPTILSLETAMESIIWHLHIAAPLTLSHTTSSHTSTPLDECSSDEHRPHCTGNSLHMSYSPVPQCTSQPSGVFKVAGVWQRVSGVRECEFHTVTAHDASPTFTQNVTQPDAPHCLRPYFVEKWLLFPYFNSFLSGNPLQVAAMLGVLSVGLH